MNNAERKIKVALDEAASHHRGGMSPDESVAKAAIHNKLNPDMTHRVVEAFNISKNNATIARATDKTASFPLADASNVMGLVFKPSAHPKKAADEYENDPKGRHAITDALIEIEEIRQPIELDWTGREKIAAPLEDISDIVQQALGSTREMEAELSKAAQDCTQLEGQAFNHMREVVEFFALSDNVGKFAEFEEDVYSEYGPDAATTLDIIHELCGGVSRKEARRQGDMPKIGSRRIEPTAAHTAFDALMEKTGAFHEATDRHEKLAAELAGKKAEVRDLMFEASGRSVSKAASAADLLDFDSLKKKTADLMLAAPANSVVGAAQSGMNSSTANIYGKAHEKAHEQRYKGVKDRADLEIDNAKRMAILRELTSNDDIISKVPHGELEHHYNTLLGIAPDLTLHPSIVRSYLRQAAANQAVDPFTALQFSQLQGQHSKNKMLRDGKAPAPGL